MPPNLRVVVAGGRIDEEVALFGVAGDHRNHRDALRIELARPAIQIVHDDPGLAGGRTRTIIRSEEELFGPARKASRTELALGAVEVSTVEVAANHGHVADCRYCIAGRPIQ